MGKRENFTADRVAKFRCAAGKQQSIYWDAKAPGLGLRVTAAGAKSYVFETRLHGRTVRLTIGDQRTWSIAKAQAEVTRLKAMTDQGVDPRLVAQEQRAKADEAHRESKRKHLTIGDVWPLYLEDRKSKWGELHYRDHVRLAAPGGKHKRRGRGLTVAGPLAPLLTLRLSDLTSFAVAEWLAKEASRRSTKAAQAFRLLRAFVEWLADKPAYRGLVPADALEAKFVKEAVPASRAKEGDSLQREQLAAWLASVRALSNPVVSVYLQALLITGARPNEMARMQWTDVDFEWRSLTLRDKVEGSRTIPLTPYLATLLQALKQRNDMPPNIRLLKRIEDEGKKWEPSPWVFSSRTAAGGRLVDPSDAHNRCQEKAGLPHVTLHGLRRSFGTLCEWVEVPSGVSAQIMGHKPSALAEKHYRRRPLDLLRTWHDKIEAWMLEQAGIEFEQTQPALRAIN
ncbi:MAG TPA: integrase family protein [Rhodocyclaceae bacterium]|uniref:tyrosine-type recombinase/integrase n=1 Tax=Accumulibacter sp. TaxID=2053492 RepID=UPI002BC8830B|nr:integrase family protein [Accumulibacter sp.]HMZ82670.1 integrase family protein [Rhodocyclaceae bacterium]HNA02891.1 integrase family protein [Rhodocyclaceae bacterium]HNB77351.1 integrase family protein [Rhodocyclaceae bacterium]HNC19939.1 integrase family protein [Accumulibacter sp.]HNF91173.1 integrase family protein [Accumulibacter sp.]